MSCSISFDVDDVESPAIDKPLLRQWLKSVAEKHGCRVGSLAYVFCSDNKILEVNKQFLQHDYFTDIITFDYTEGRHIAGDMYISLDTVRSNAEQFGASFSQELHRVIVHGVLHLCGINDKGPGEREVMEANENEALELLGFLDRKAKEVKASKEALKAAEADAGASSNDPSANHPASAHHCVQAGKHLGNKKKPHHPHNDAGDKQAE